MNLSFGVPFLGKVTLKNLSTDIEPLIFGLGVPSKVSNRVQVFSNGNAQACQILRKKKYNLKT